MIGRSRYRLATTRGLRFLRAVRGPLGHVDFAGWLGRNLLWVDGWLAGVVSDQLDLSWGATTESASEVVGTFLYSRPELDPYAGARGLIVVVRTPSETDGIPSLDSLWIRTNEQDYRWTSYRGLGLAADLVARFERRLPLIPLEIGNSLLDFVGPVGFGISREDDPLLARNLATLRRVGSQLGWSVERLEEKPESPPSDDDELLEEEPDVRHESDQPSDAGEPLGPTEETVVASEVAKEAVQDGLPDENTGEPVGDENHFSESESGPPIVSEIYPPYSASASEPIGFCIDRSIQVDDETLFLSGWIWDLEMAVSDIYWVTPSGRHRISEHVERFERQGVADFYRGNFGALAEGKHGFLATFENPGGLAIRRECHLEFDLAGRPAARIGLSPILRDPFVARDQVFAVCPDEQWVSTEFLSGSLHRALSRLSRRCHLEEISWKESRFGTSGGCKTSLVVPLGENVHMLEAQLASFAEDSRLDSLEVLYVLDQSRLGSWVEDLLLHCQQLYHLPPVRLVVVDRTIGSAAACNLGASLAQGENLVFLHSDVLAEDRGWLEPIVQKLRIPGVGAVGPLLVAAGGAVSDAGVVFRQADQNCLWMAEDRFSGLPVGVGSSAVSTRVPALRDACLAIRRELFDALGGFSDCFVAGDSESLDLCLRVAESGLTVWCLAEKPLMHLGAQTKQHGQGWRRNRWGRLYNRWLLTQRWGEALARGTADTQ